MNRHAASITMLVENPHANVKTEYTRMLALNIRRRPSRSARTPKTRPPTADAINVSAFKSPAVVRLMPNARINVASTIEYSITSNASSIHPRAAAITTRRCAVVAALQLNAVFVVKFAFLEMGEDSSCTAFN